MTTPHLYTRSKQIDPAEIEKLLFIAASILRTRFTHDETVAMVPKLIAETGNMLRAFQKAVESTL